MSAFQYVNPKPSRTSDTAVNKTETDENTQNLRTFKNYKSLTPGMQLSCKALTLLIQIECKAKRNNI